MPPLNLQRWWKGAVAVPAEMPVAAPVEMLAVEPVGPVLAVPAATSKGKTTH